MSERTRTYFVSDVHLGFLRVDPEEREERFTRWLLSIEKDARTLYLLGDIWDFWYEYKYCIPKVGVRVIGALMHLMRQGVEIYACPGNHDVWYYHYFKDIGIKVISQPHFVEIDGKTFCVGHGDNLYGAGAYYRFVQWMFHNKVLQTLFSSLHPRLAFGWGTRWSRNYRAKNYVPYVWKGGKEPLCVWAEKVLETRKVDYFVFGHFHVAVQETLSGGAQLTVMRDWIYGDRPHAIFDGEKLTACV